MSEEIVNDGSSHYEVSLTGGQALAAFLLMLASLAASFGFGLMLGRGHGEDPLVRRQTPLINEGGGVRPRDSEQAVAPAAGPPAAAAAESAPPTILEEQPSQVSRDEGSGLEPVAGMTPALPSSTLPQPVTSRAASKAPPAAGPFFAQVLSASDVRSAEGLAARLIEKGYTSAYVERVNSDRGMTYRVRVRFATESEARAAVEPLKTLTKGDVWITR